MPTTSNFGWTTPADTDLVKDGAAAIRTLGNGIDTSLVDLKGGTTGQVLSKASNTDLDFTWSSVDPLTILDAKGDLISATAADTPARLAVGTNGQVLSADSTTSTGLKWITPSSGGDWTQAASGSLSGTSVSITGLSGKQYYVWCEGWSHNSSGASRKIGLQFNGDTGSNYYSQAVSYSQIRSQGICPDTETRNAAFFINLADKAVDKPVLNIVDTENEGEGGGVWNNTDAITSIQIVLSGSGSFDAGTYQVWSFA